MSEIQIVKDGYIRHFGEKDINIVPLPQSGSDRKYFRIFNGKESVIGAYNMNFEENEAFIGFSKHFLSGGLPVPEIYAYMPEEFIYYLQDLGDINVFTWLQQKQSSNGFDADAEAFYGKILDKLISFQIDGMKGLNLDLCYPHRSFDRQSMMWDMNYFKYMFLKLLAAPFNERKLESDFNLLADFLLEERQEYFLYRDFQSANVMIYDGEPWFIDYQGGRKGAPQYDVASLLFDAKAHIPESVRQRLLNDHIDKFCAISGQKPGEFRGYYAGFSMIRLMQAMGAFGFRGLYEKKPTFTGSIVPAVRLINNLIETEKLPIQLNELYQTIRLIPGTTIYKELESRGGFM
jgi:aminoglycoside/choline kinase family phosphotransferase